MNSHLSQSKLFPRNRLKSWIGCVCSLLLLIASAQITVAQPPDPDGLMNEFTDLVGGNEQDPSQEKVTWYAEFTSDESGKKGEVHVTADIINGWHIFSLTQESGPTKTTIMFEPGFEDVKLIGEFEGDREPYVHYDKIYKTDVGEYEGTVTFTAPIEFADGVDPEKVAIPVLINGQTCENGEGGVCVQIENVIAEAFWVEPQEEFSGKIKPAGNHLEITGSYSPTTAKAGDTVNITIGLNPDSDWRVQEYSPNIEADGSIPTLIYLTKKHDSTAEDAEVSGEATLLEDETGTQRDYYNQPVTVTIPIKLPSKMEKKAYDFEGLIAFESSSSEEVLKPSAVAFRAEVTVAGQSNDETGKLVFTLPKNSDYADIAELVQKDAESAKGGAFEGWPVPLILGASFLAGLILNIMPCVLPVIGLKVLSFVQQAGENPGRILLLNLTFAAGLLSVFMVLAALAAFFQVGWGGLFTNTWFTVVIVVVVFAFGLSFFGVWEIPIPGFVSGGGANKLAEREGYMGAFSKGILTTILATPCSGPFLIPAVTWAIAQPPILTFAVFFAMGIGMAFPYIVIGFQPKLVNMLPKPGMWMETFKQFMGFLMMGTAVFFYVSIPDKYEIPVLALLVFVGLACWFAGRIKLTDPFPARVRGWIWSGATVAFGCFIAFYVMIPQHPLDWQPYSKVALEEQLAEGNTVFIDFTADW